MPAPNRTRLLTQSQVERLVDVPTALRVVARAFRAQSLGQVVMPPKVYLPLPRGSDFRAMPAYLRSPNACGMKWVNVHPHNRRVGLPTVMALVVLNDPATGFPLAVMDGVSITKIRTAAAGGVAARALARRNARTAALIGCGGQALWQLRVLQASVPIDAVRVWGSQPGEAAAFIRRAQRHLRVRLAAAATIRDAVTDADVIVTLTPSRTPLVQRAWIAPGAHLNAIGADAPGKQELDPAILRDAVLVVDELAQSMHGGEVNVPLAKGQLRRADIDATLGDILTGKAPGRTDPRQITVFDSTGLAVHDIALGHEVVRRAAARGAGRLVRFFDRPPGAV
jgi:alanine dehydrogenase